MFSNKFRKIMSSVLCASLLITTTLTQMANAQSVTCSSSSADSGADNRCAAVRIGGVPVSYPKFQWDFVSDLALAPTPGSKTVTGGSQAVTLGNRTALALGLNASDVANVATVFPANVPYVFARYNPYDSTLFIDIFKLEKTSSAAGPRAGLYHTAFSPSHGDKWKANRSYISPSDYQSGVVPGVNPFSSFIKPGSDGFQNISLTAAQVAIGHAMRSVGAPVALLSVASNRLSQTTSTSGGWFTKTTTTTVYGNVSSQWYIAQPTGILDRSTTSTFAAICAADATTSDCPRYATAVSGVSFEQFNGGTLSAIEDQFQLDQSSHTGLSFLGALILVVVGSFALAGILASAGIVGAAGGATAAGASASAATGTFGSLLLNTGLITEISSVGQAIAIETAYSAVSMAVLGGANLGSTINADPGILMGHVQVAPGFQAAPSSVQYGAILNAQISPRTLTSLTAPGAPLLKGFGQTVTGNCAVGQALAQCAGASGVVPRADQYLEQNYVEFVRDNQGNTLIDEPILPPTQ